MSVRDLSSIPAWKRSDDQPAFPLTSVELADDLAHWKARALDAEEKLEKVDAAMCTVLGHKDDAEGDWCKRCGENLRWS